MDEEEYTDRRSEALNATIMFCSYFDKPPSIAKTREYLELFYAFLVKDDLTLTKEANVITIKRD